jgi:raffinose/stachyose/melibiose transport system permease protein
LRRWALAFLVPATLVYVLTVIYPAVRVIQYGFFNWQTGGPLKWAGLSNYTAMFHDPVFVGSVEHTAELLAGAMVIQIPLGFLFALLIFKRYPGHRLYRTVYFIPVVLSTVVIGELWTEVYATPYGLLNAVIRLLHLGNGAQSWLGDPKTALWSVIVVVGWQYVGLYVLIFLSAMQAIPRALFEAAALDGAVGWAQTRRLTIPVLLDTFKLAFILLVAGSVQYFNLVWVMTEGGPANASQVIASYMFIQAFTNNQLGYASAVATFMLLSSLVLAIALQRLFRRAPLELA